MLPRGEILYVLASILVYHDCIVAFLSVPDHNRLSYIPCVEGAIDYWIQKKRILVLDVAFVLT